MKNTRNKCPACYGFGLWAIGDACPMGPMDFADGSPVKRCPECGSGNIKEYWETADGRIIYARNIEDEHLKNIVLLLIETGKKSRTIEKEVKRRRLATKKLEMDLKRIKP